MKKFFALVVLFLMVLSAMAQVPGRREKLPPGVSLPRYDDHFFRRKILYRIDLNEKQNKDLIKSESALYLPGEGRDGKIMKTKGLVNALLHAYEHGFDGREIIAYNPDTLNKEVLFANFKTKLLKKAGIMTTDVEPATDGDSDEMDSEDEFEDDEDWGDEGGGSSSDAGTTASADSSGDNLQSGGLTYDDAIRQNLESVVEIVEDRIFDKNKSDMYYDLQFIRIVFIDETGAGATDEVMLAFKYEDVMDIMNQTQWKNKHNDAEYRTMQEILENRNFNSFFTDVSGLQMLNLRESEKRRQQIVEFEHHLWEF